MLKSRPKPPSAEAGQEKAATAPRPKKTRWWAYAAGLLCLALAWPLYQYNVSHWRTQRALSSLEAGDTATAINLLEVEQQAEPKSAEIAYWLGVAHRRAGHIRASQEHLERARGLGYPLEEVDRQLLLTLIQTAQLNPELEQRADQLIQKADSYSGPRVDLYIDEFYEARAKGYLANYLLFDTELALDHWVAARPNSFPARLMRAELRERQQNFKAAEREYGEVLVVAPGNLQARLQRARLLKLNLKVDEAAEEYRTCLQSAPHDVQAQIGLAECEFRGGQGTEAARERLLKVLEQELSPTERVDALLLLGEIARSQKDNELVVKYLTEAVKLSPNTLSAAPYNTLSAAHARLNHRDEAAKYLKISREKLERNHRLFLLADKILQAPGNAQLRFEQGNILMEGGQADEAAAWWYMAVRFDPQFQAAHEALADYYAAKGDNERTEYHRRLAEQSAEATFNTLWFDLLDSNTKSVRDGLPKLARYPALSEPVELLTLGLNVVEHKDIERSAQGLGRLTNNPKLRLRALTMLAEALYEMGHYNAAERAYKEVLATSPNNIVAHKGLQSIYFDLGAYDQMELHALEVARIDPTDYRPHRHMAFLRREAENWEAAILDYKESLRRSPHQPTREEVLLEMADCYVHALKYEDALARLKDARPSAQKSFLGAQCNYATKNVAEAKKLLDKSLKDAPDHAPSLLLRSDIALVEDDAPAAREFLERGIKAAPYDNSAHQKLSTVLLRLGEKEAAKKEADRAKELLDLQLRFSELNNQASQRPKDIQVRIELAALARQLGREEEAKRWEGVVDGMKNDPVPEPQGPTVSFPIDRKPASLFGPQPPEKKAGAKGKGR